MGMATLMILLPDRPLPFTDWVRFRPVGDNLLSMILQLSNSPKENYGSTEHQEGNRGRDSEVDECVQGSWWGHHERTTKAAQDEQSSPRQDQRCSKEALG
jgi:hypothetical protein